MPFDDAFPAVAGFGLIALLVWAGVIVGGFVLSAWIMSLYLRLVIHFSRKTLDREYRFMRGDYSSSSKSASVRQAGPRNW